MCALQHILWNTDSATLVDYNRQWRYVGTRLDNIHFDGTGRLYNGLAATQALPVERQLHLDIIIQVIILIHSMVNLRKIINF